MTEDAAGSTKETTDSPQGPQNVAPQALQVGTSAPPSVAIVLAGTLGLAAASWVLSIRLMSGMDMGVATEIGSFAFFVALWVTMMAAMMLPGAAPAVLSGVH
jgi:predicted metal-binding membrane protein